jgi:hypothetical protein
LQDLNRNSGFKKNANFSSENWRKSQKIVSITSTPGLAQLTLTSFTQQIMIYYVVEKAYKEQIITLFVKTNEQHFRLHMYTV